MKESYSNSNKRFELGFPGGVPSTNIGDIHIQGTLKHRLEACISCLSQPVFNADFLLSEIVAHPKTLRFGDDWHGDTVGRFIEAFTYVEQFSSHSNRILHEIIKSIPEHQLSDGTIGGPVQAKHPGAEKVWGQGRLLTGLGTYLCFHKDANLLSCANRLAAYYNTYADKLVSLGTQCLSAIEGLARLYGTTTDKMADETIHKLATELPPVDSGRFHSHGYLCALRGMLEFDILRGEAEYIGFSQAQWETIAEKMLLPDYGVCESFPRSQMNEGCSEADWFRLNLLLWQFTGNTRYLDMAERTLWNAVFFNQNPDGSFGHRGLNENGFTKTIQATWWCCTFHGLMAYIDALRYAITTQPEKISVNFYFPGVWTTGGRTLQIETQYPSDGKVSITLDEAGEFELCLRVPSWATFRELQVNGSKVTAFPTEGKVCVRRQWKRGDDIALHLEWDLRRESSGNGWESLWYGPLALTTNPEMSSVPATSDNLVFELPPVMRKRSEYGIGLQDDAAGWFLPSGHPHEIPGAHFQLRQRGKKPNGSFHPTETLGFFPIAEYTGWLYVSDVPLRFKFTQKH